MTQIRCPACDGLLALNPIVEKHHAILQSERERAARLEETLGRVRAFLAEWEDYWAIPPDTERVFQKKLRAALGEP